MAATHKGAISFGFVHIPISLYTATQDADLHFNQLHKEDNSRIRYKKVCSHCGKEVKSEDIVKGFEFDKDEYVIMTDDDFEQAKTEKDKTIHLLHFTDLNSIEPIYFEKTYHAVPDSGADEAFQLLRKAMLDSGKIAVAQTVMGNSEKLLTLIPTEEGLLVETMFFENEIKEIPKAIKQVEIKPAELKLANTIIDSMTKDFDPTAYKDNYQIRLREIIENKRTGKETASDKGEAPNNVISLQDALKRTIEESKKKTKKTTEKKTAKTKSARKGA